MRVSSFLYFFESRLHYLVEENNNIYLYEI